MFSVVVCSFPLCFAIPDTPRAESPQSWRETEPFARLRTLDGASLLVQCVAARGRRAQAKRGKRASVVGWPSHFALHAAIDGVSGARAEARLVGAEVEDAVRDLLGPAWPTEGSAKEKYAIAAPKRSGVN